MVTLTTEVVEIANKPRTLIAHTHEATDTLIIFHARHSNGDSKLLVFSPDIIPFLKLVLIYPSVLESTGFITQKKNTPLPPQKKKKIDMSKVHNSIGKLLPK